MALTLDFPNIQGLSEQAQVKRLTDYMYSLTEQLNYLLNNLDTDNFTADTAQLLQSAQTNAKQAADAASALEQSQQAHVAALKREILTRADLTLQQAQAKLEAGQAAVLSTVSAQYAAKSETAALSQQVTSALEQTAHDLTLRFTEANTYTLEVDEQLRELIDELRTYIRFDADGIQLGQVDSPFTSVLSNSKLSFLQSGVEIAYISNNKMYITRAEIADGLTIGGTARGYFDFQTEPNGSLSLTRRNG